MRCSVRTSTRAMAVSGGRGRVHPPGRAAPTSAASPRPPAARYAAGNDDPVGDLAGLASPDPRVRFAAQDRLRGRGPGRRRGPGGSVGGGAPRSPCACARRTSSGSILHDRAVDAFRAALPDPASPGTRGPARSRWSRPRRHPRRRPGRARPRGRTTRRRRRARRTTRRPRRPPACARSPPPSRAPGSAATPPARTTPSGSTPARRARAAYGPPHRLGCPVDGGRAATGPRVGGESGSRSTSSCGPRPRTARSTWTRSTARS